MRGPASAGASGAGGEVPLTELTIGQALASAREQFIKSMGTQSGQGF